MDNFLILSDKIWMGKTCINGKNWCVYKEHIWAGIVDPAFRYTPSSTWVFWTNRHCKCWKNVLPNHLVAPDILNLSTSAQEVQI